MCSNSDDEMNQEERKETNVSLPNFSYLMCTQLNWEDDIIYKIDDVKKNIKDKVKNNQIFYTSSKMCFNRNLAFNLNDSTENRRNMSSERSEILLKTALLDTLSTDKNCYEGFWEDTIIYETSADKSEDELTEPIILYESDDDLIFNVPDDIQPPAEDNKELIPTTTEMPNTTNSSVPDVRYIRTKDGVDAIKNDSIPPARDKKIDPFNLSNDDYYIPNHIITESLREIGNYKNLQHAIPVTELWPQFLPTRFDKQTLRNLYRPALKSFADDDLNHTLLFPIIPLTSYIKQKARQREEESKAFGGISVFNMREPEDLTARDGTIVLFEFREQYPPLMNQIGMCSNIINYYKRTANRDIHSQQYKFGEWVAAYTSPFLGELADEQCIQTLENNMYRAPIYEHKPDETDFLLIRRDNNYGIRNIDALFTVGQECPLVIVPEPNSKDAKSFIKDFLKLS